MSSNHYKLYLDSVLQLAETLVIKSEYTAQKINEYVDFTYGQGLYDINDKTTWKYYLNVSGEYFRTDSVIKITSLDTLELIDFSKDQLALHPATKQAYQHNSRYYRELVFLYPEMEQLILGVLYPVDIQIAIDAPDFSVISYPPALIEDNEYSLITNINKWLENFDIRWNNKQFHISDDLFGTAVIGVLSAQLVPLILNLRLRACHTAEAHSFHVREFLASHGMLDKYLDAMTHTQAMFFYKNIRYIEHHYGKTDTFDWLIDNVMTERNLPLSEYSMSHDTTNMAETLIPDIVFKKTLINKNQVNNAQSNASYQLDVVLAKEALLAPENYRYSNDNKPVMLRQFERSLSASLSTKVLESSMVDYTDAVPFTIHDAFINNWVNYTNTNQFANFYIRINSPKTNKELVINIKDSYSYYFYAIARSSGIDLEYFPLFLAKMILKNPLPTQSDLLGVTSETLVTSDEAQAILDSVPTLKALNNILDFRDNCKDIHSSIIAQLYYVYRQEDLSKRAQIQAAVNLMYNDVYFQPPDVFISIKDWIEFRDLEHEGYNDQDWADLALNIYQGVSGFDMRDTNNVVGVQKAMVGLLTQLSSYSIQVISDINETPLQTPYWNTIRLENISSIGNLYSSILLGFFKIFKHVSYPSDYGSIGIEDIIDDVTIINPQQDNGPMIFPIDLSSDRMPFEFGMLDAGMFRLNQDNLPLPADANDYSDFQNFAAFASMTEEQRSEIVDVYSGCHAPYEDPVGADVATLLFKQDVPGLLYQYPRTFVFKDFEYKYIPPKTVNFSILGSEVELNAFYDNFGSEIVPNFMPNKGSAKLNTFHYFAEMPVEQEMLHFGNTAGWTYVSVFSPIKEGDSEIEFNGLKYLGATQEISSINYFNEILDSRGLVNTINDLEVTLSYYRRSADIGRLKFLGMSDMELDDISYVNDWSEIGLTFVAPITVLDDMMFQSYGYKEIDAFTISYSNSSLLGINSSIMNGSLPNMKPVTFNHEINDIADSFGGHDFSMTFASSQEPSGGFSWAMGEGVKWNT